MPDAVNQLTVTGLRATAVTAQPRVAVGMSIARLQALTLIAGDETAPHFLPANRPVVDGQPYQDTAGAWYYRPTLRVHRELVAPNGPEVRFLKDAEGKVRLELELEESPPNGLPDGAEPFPVRISELKLTWNDRGTQRSKAFPEPVLVVAQETDDEARPNFSVVAGTELTPDEVQLISEALRNRDAAATLSITFSFGFWVDEEAAPAPRPDPPGPRGPIRLPDVLVRRTFHSSAAAMPLMASGLSATSAGRRRAPIVRDHRTGTDTPVVRDHRSRRLRDVVIARPDWSVIVDRQRERERDPKFQSPSVTHTFDFFFDPDLEQHRRIYAAIRTEGGPTNEWQSHPFGMIARAPTVNTVYRLPDEVRLAYSQDLKAPHVRPTLYTNDAGETMVRVELRGMPWHDSNMLVSLRDELLRASGGSLAAPRVIIGGYQSATLRLTSAFPEALRLLGSEETPVTLEGGFDLLLDVTLEFYRFLCELLVGPIGLTGIVSVTLPAPEGAQPMVKQIPVRLNLDDFAGMPLEVTLPEDSVSPTSVTLLNKAGAPVQIGGCVSRLLQIDQNSVTPLEVYDAETTTVFPVVIPSDGSLAIDVKPELADLLWNAVQIEVLGAGLTQTPAEVLDRVHELPGTGAFAWRIQVECPVFLSSPLPEQFKNLHRVQIEVSREGFAPQEAVLGAGQTEATISMQRSLKEILRDNAAGLATFKYRVRNVYLDHIGQWSPLQDGQGNTIFVFPNPAAND